MDKYSLRINQKVTLNKQKKVQTLDHLIEVILTSQHLFYQLFFSTILIPSRKQIIWNLCCAFSIILLIQVSYSERRFPRFFSHMMKWKNNWVLTHFTYQEHQASLIQVCYHAIRFFSNTALFVLIEAASFDWNVFRALVVIWIQGTVTDKAFKVFHGQSKRHKCDNKKIV